MSDPIIDAFNAERNAVLQTLDEEKIRAFLLKHHGERGPLTQESFWRGVHKSITAIPGLPLEFRKASKKWLVEHGSPSMDDGDL